MVSASVDNCIYSNIPNFYDCQGEVRGAVGRGIGGAGKCVGKQGKMNGGGVGECMGQCSH